MAGQKRKVHGAAVGKARTRVKEHDFVFTLAFSCIHGMGGTFAGFRFGFEERLIACRLKAERILDLHRFCSKFCM